ncbi:hypothetical protein [Methylobacter sp.]|uniref:hypothetical protein n=1 Tax=Methylobacter sp. TaxID=2051955 RepID=UPI00120180E3|nr:hypothetical protein [Methylobacter sp.]TAK60987.1 MAG: hypothetical protein EPO18_15450 [Methylobacter sp.]
MIKCFIFVISIFMVNVVSAQELKCPDKVYSESELINIVEEARKSRTDLPGKYLKYETSVIKLRCLYILYERPIPATEDVYQTFTIDPYGELMDFYVNKK